MEKKEFQSLPNYRELFDRLPFNGHMKMPMSILTPITIDDLKKTETKGPLDVFAKKDKLYIDDGNHRYFDKKREIFIQNDYQDVDLNNVFMEIKKIDPQKAINSWMMEY